MDTMKPKMSTSKIKVFSVFPIQFSTSFLDCRTTVTVWKKCILKGIWQPRWLWWLLVALSTLCWLAVHIWKRVTGSGPPTFRQRNAIQCNANRCKAISIWSYFQRWGVEVNVHMYFSLGGRETVSGRGRLAYWARMECWQFARHPSDADAAA